MTSPTPHHDVDTEVPRASLGHKYASQMPAILLALRESGQQRWTVPEIAERAGVAEVTARRHVATLRTNGQVRPVGRRPRRDEHGRALCSRGRDEYVAELDD